MKRLLIILMLVALPGCFRATGGEWLLRAEDGRIDGAPTSRPSDQSIVVATYNIHGSADPEGLRSDMQRLDADVWLLEEVGIKGFGSAEESLKRFLPAGEWYFSVVPVNRSANGWTEAQAIVSRRRITQTMVLTLTANPTRRRCALAAWIQFDGTALMFVDTDHEPGYFDTSAPHDRQLTALIEELSRFANQPTVIGGDFNTCGNFWRLRSSFADARGAIERMRLMRFKPVTDAPVATLVVWPVVLYLDHIFVRDLEVLNAGVDERCSGSDHRPVWCRIRIVK